VSTPVPSTPPACAATFAPATGDQTAAITTFLVANKGKTACFAPGATYTVSGRITLTGWTGTVLGQGATFALGAQGFRLLDSPGPIVIDGLNFRGSATLYDIQHRVFGSGDRESEHAIGAESVANLTIRNLTATNLWGDAVYLRAHYTTTPPSSNVLVENVTADIIGRNGISFISVDGVTVRSVRISNAALHAIDGEPNNAADVLRNVTIEGCDLRTFDAGHTASGPGYAVVLTSGYAAGVPIDNIVIRNNTMDRPMVRVDGSTSIYATNVSVTGNRPEVAGAATFRYIRGFVFSDNGLMTASLTDVQ
jgi:hypothetical protein